MNEVGVCYIFFFINEESIANYADDNTVHARNNQIDTLINTLEEVTSILKNWLMLNYFIMNAEKCKLLVTNYTC